MSSADSAHSSDSNTPYEDERRRSSQNNSYTPQIHIVSDEHNTDMLLHSEYSDWVRYETNDDTRGTQSLPAYWTVRRPGEASSDSRPTTPHSFSRVKHMTFRRTSYIPLHRASDAYSTDSRNAPRAWNRGPNRIHVGTLYSKTRTSYHFLVRLDGQLMHFVPTTSDPSDATPSNEEGKRHIPPNHTVSLGCNTHTIGHY